ncbi:MAG: hypothetical protein RLZZ627_741 [Pseudomonadota bacterium]
MSSSVLRIEGLAKKFNRSPSRALKNGLLDFGTRLLGRTETPRLREAEFWALRDVALDARRGECIGVIGPNGAGKSTLLRIINGDIRPDAGKVFRRGSITPLIRLGGGLQPLLTGRENIYTKCQEFGFDTQKTDALVEPIVAFSGLRDLLDVPVRQYSDGMYARLEFAIATAVPMDLLLIDEVLAVGDMAFQMRCLERLAELKAAGTTVLFVSHSEMNVRQIADRCLLLFEGESLGVGETDAMFRRYYEATGFLDRNLKPMGIAPDMPVDFDTTGLLAGVALVGAGEGVARIASGSALRFHLDLRSVAPNEVLVLQCWSPSGVLLASAEAELAAGGTGRWEFEIPRLGLAAGRYRLACGIRGTEGWLGYSSQIAELAISEDGLSAERGLFRLEAKLTPAL